jgi:hypothetical protein
MMANLDAMPGFYSRIYLHVLKTILAGCKESWHSCRWAVINGSVGNDPREQGKGGGGHSVLCLRNSWDTNEMQS